MDVEERCCCTLKMEAVRSSEALLISTTLHGVTFLKTILIVTAVDLYLAQLIADIFYHTNS
jgi:hypothetical protein